jgi:hypothetical protein
VHRTSPWRPGVTLSDKDGCIAITVEGHTRGATTADPLDEPQILCEIADHIQEDLCESKTVVWPTCARHDVGLHAEVHDGQALWWCHFGDHPVAAIGALGS